MSPYWNEFDRGALSYDEVMKLFEKENKLYHFISTLKANYGDFIGLSGFGEQLGFIHLNQSMVIAVFE